MLDAVLEPVIISRMCKATKISPPVSNDRNSVIVRPEV
jgi:hypothetical protein